ncbi:MAG: hypothetical protein A2934_00695 [Candidatus Sungbacteria bacterium RIFCSPLOWO2_01_FULL_47_10]|uniref:Uncharacterized protein n=1 Tax=Candidatus Sungbacteria bacterium RIFCSPLOWO2_01_FULL_47_10 TaxID=1802276 RepID=A0A1G2L6L3_9BACT|nr:MAG: hypothetical protein A2934_00695 [Candidatus Sungbacteria bacterium RIFCSPLOWO2_01_FULL_47_10]
MKTFFAVAGLIFFLFPAALSLLSFFNIMPRTDGNVMIRVDVKIWFLSMAVSGLLSAIARMIAKAERRDKQNKNGESL